MSISETARPEPDTKVHYVVQYRVRIHGRTEWGHWSVGEPKGAGRPDAAIRFVAEQRAKADEDCEWRVVRVTQEVIH